VRDKSAPTDGRGRLFIYIIGGVRDKSAPTDGRGRLLHAIIAPIADDEFSKNNPGIE
jgi:hypothetical protein